jgi:AcrR family transcriptional regulator
MAKQPRGVETRARILESAEQTFALVGYDATGVSTICKVAGVSKGAFYHHFTSKEEIFLELLDRWLMSLDSQLLSISESGASLSESLDQLGRLAPQILQQAGGQYAILLEFWTKARSNPKVWHATISYFERYRDFFANLLGKETAQGLLPSTDGQAAAEVLVSMIVGILLWGALDPKAADWPKVTRTGLNLFLCGLKCKGESL